MATYSGAACTHFRKEASDISTRNSDETSSHFMLPCCLCCRNVPDPSHSQLPTFRAGSLHVKVTTCFTPLSPWHTISPIALLQTFGDDEEMRELLVRRPLTNLLHCERFWNARGKVSARKRAIDVSDISNSIEQ